MKPETSRICLALTLLGLTVAALLTGLRAHRDGIAVEAHVAGMQLQAMPEADAAAATPDEKIASPESLLTFAVVSGAIPGGKALAITLDDHPAKSDSAAKSSD